MKHSLFLTAALLLGSTRAEIIDFNAVLTLKRAVSSVSSTALFNKLIAGKVFVEFYQQNCPPCKALARTLERLSQRYPTVKFIKIDVRKSREFATRYGIRGTPTSMIFVNGAMVERITGSKSYGELEALVKEYLL